MDVRSLQKPLKERYRNDPTASRITLRAKGGQSETPATCSVDIGRATYRAEAIDVFSSAVGETPVEGSLEVRTR